MKTPFSFFCAFFLLSSHLMAQNAQKDAENRDQQNVTAQEKNVQSAAKKKRWCRSYVNPQYRQMRQHWRVIPHIPKPKYRNGYRDLTLYSVNSGDRIRVFPFLKDGSLDPETTYQISRLLRDKNTEAIHPVDPRLIKLVYKLAERFKARQLNIISGYRQSIDEKSESKHAMGKAVDFNIPGVSLAGLAQKARQLGHVGVGFYPISGFVHLDVREGPSYFWIDKSGPGQPSCHQRMAGQAAKFDRRYKPEDDEPKQVLDRNGQLLDDSMTK